MKFEKNSSYTEITPMSGCSGCSNDGAGAYNGNHTNQGSSNAGRCSNCS